MNLRRTLCLLVLLAACCLAARPAEAAQFVLSGTMQYEDGNPDASLNLSGSFLRPARLVRISVEDDDGDVFGRSFTDDRGHFELVVNAPNDERLFLFADVDNSILELYLNTDGENDPLRLSLGEMVAGHATDFAFTDAELEVRAVYRDRLVHEAPSFLPIDLSTYVTRISFAGALNVNEVIVQAHDMALANRDPGETDTLGQVTVEYCDVAAPFYFFDLVLSCPRIDGAPNPRSNGVDDGFTDALIAHEYAHHLQYEIGAWDGHWEDHFSCVETDTFFNDDPEIAWSEGFADFFGEHMAVRGDRMSNVELAITQSGGNAEDGCPSTRYTSNDDERFLSVEGHLIAALWDLTDPLGSGADAWDRVDGAFNGDGFRSIFQIFDKELGTWDAPDLGDFYDAWGRRHGNSPSFGLPALDAILNRYEIVAGGDGSPNAPGGVNPRGVEKMRPEPLIEAKPVLPDDYESTYRPGDFTPLTVTRHHSFARRTGTATQFVVHVGVTNLGPMTMESDFFSGVLDESMAASYTTNIRWLRGRDWLAVDPAAVNPLPIKTLRPVTFRFLPAALTLTPGDRYHAMVDFVVRLTRTDGFTHFQTRTVEVFFDFQDGPRTDVDNDGLRSEEEEGLRARFACLNAVDPDSDDDRLWDGEEVEVYGTSPCLADTDGDGFSDYVETRESCFQPLVPDDRAAPNRDPDGDGLTNAQELALRTQLCDGDTDNDNIHDGIDNCKFLATPEQLSDTDKDGEGDLCDNDADDDGCEKQYDANDTQASSLCLLATRDRFSGRRYIPSEDVRLLFVDVYLENLGRPTPRNCGSIACPPPMAQWTDPRFETTGLVRGADFGLGVGDGFAWSAAVLPDLDGRGKRDLAVSAPWADGTGLVDAGVVLLLAGEDNRELGRLRGTVAGGAFGSSLALLKDGRLAIGAPGATGKAGTVQVYRLDTQKVDRTFTAGRADDRFGAALADLGDTDGDGRSDLAIGAPGWGGFGAVYTARSNGTLAAIAVAKVTGERLGERLAAVSDTDGDGKPELLAGSPGATRSEFAGAGEVALFGLDGTKRWSKAGRQAGEALGSSLAVRESSKGTELLVGAPGASCTAGARCGRGYLMRPDGSGIGFITGTEAGAELGRYVAFGPDLDGDGLPSLVLVEPVPSSAAGMGRSQFFER